MSPDPKNEKTSGGAPTPSAARLPRGMLQRKCACGGSAGLSGECAECQKNHLQLKAADADEQTEVPPIVHEVLRSPGAPLDAETRAAFEPRFRHDFSRVRVHAAPSSDLAVAPAGSASEQEADRVADHVLRQQSHDGRAGEETGPVDFSQVRIHSDSQAAESARAVNALAYTVGSHIVFASEHYNPGTMSGRRLLAHELTHVAQQSSGIQSVPAVQRKKPEVSILVEGECKAPKSIAMAAVWGARMVRAALDWFLSSVPEDELILNSHLRANFGSDSAETRKAVHSRLVQVSAYLERAQRGGLTFSCPGAKDAACKEHVAEAQKGSNRIVLCPNWFDEFASFGINYGGYSLIHECCHLAGAVEKKEVYQSKIYGGLDMTQCLQHTPVGSDPLNNADNYAWFVNCLALPAGAEVFPGLTIKAKGKGQGKK
ncbi:MAG TPA: DUF4157 domain-containing protein [Candidatus Binatia bacterium]